MNFTIGPASPTDVDELIAAACPPFTEYAVGRCTVREYRSIADVPAGVWDTLVGPEDLQATRRFVRTCEESGIERAEYRHLLIYHGGVLAGIASLSRIRVKLDLLSSGRARRMIRGIRRVVPRFLDVPVVFCGLPVSFGQSLLRVHPQADASSVMTAVQQALDRFAHENDVSLACFKEFTDDGIGPLQPLTLHGYQRLPSLPSCGLTIRWGSWDEYLGSMRSGYRRQMVATVRAARQQGMTTRRVAAWHHECERIFALYEQVMHRAEFQLERLNLPFFQRLNANLAAESSVILVEQGEELRAAAVLLHGQQLTTFLLAGIDYQRLDTTAAYPLLVTEVVKEAIRRGANELGLGQTSYALKCRLGATTTRRHLFLRHRGTLGGPLLRLVSGSLFPELIPPPRRVFVDRA